MVTSPGMDDYKFYSQLYSDLRHEHQNTDFASNQDRRLINIKIQYIEFQLLRIRCPYLLTSQEETVLRAYYNRFYPFIDALGEPSYNCQCAEHCNTRIQLNFGRSPASDLLFKNCLHRIAIQILDYENQGYCPRYYNRKFTNYIRRENQRRNGYFDQEEDNFEDPSDLNDRSYAYQNDNLGYNSKANYSSAEDYSSQFDSEDEGPIFDERYNSSSYEDQQKSSSKIEDIRKLIKEVIGHENSDNVAIPLAWRDIKAEIIPLPWIVTQQSDNNKQENAAGTKCKPQNERQFDNLNFEDIETKFTVDNLNICENLEFRTHQNSSINLTKQQDDPTNKTELAFKCGIVNRANVTMSPLDLDTSKNVTSLDCLQHNVRNRRHDVMWWNTRFKFSVATLM